MVWPSPQDFNEAVQNPFTAFADEGLRHAHPELTALGLPKSNSGAFASVYKLTDNDGCDWAVRCFLRDVQDQETRYARISEFIVNDDLPHTVPFVYLKKGIQIGGKWYPILKMEWVYGVTLDHWVALHIDERGALNDLAHKFLEMHRQNYNAGIAHGDLQHGNILVTDSGDLRLVDYDGMFVPALKGYDANELGHRNYQHPGRHAKHFGLYLDNYSAWIIFGALRCMAMAPDLLKLRGSLDECLLFKRSEWPYGRIFWELESRQNEALGQYSKMIRWLLTQKPEHAPPLCDPPPESCWRRAPVLREPDSMFDDDAYSALPAWMRPGAMPMETIVPDKPDERYDEALTAIADTYDQAKFGELIELPDPFAAFDRTPVQPANSGKPARSIARTAVAQPAPLIVVSQQVASPPAHGSAYKVPPSQKANLVLRPLSSTHDLFPSLTGDEIVAKMKNIKKAHSSSALGHLELDRRDAQLTDADSSSQFCALLSPILFVFSAIAAQYSPAAAGATAVMGLLILILSTIASDKTRQGKERLRELSKLIYDTAPVHLKLRTASVPLLTASITTKQYSSTFHSPSHHFKYIKEPGPDETAATCATWYKGNQQTTKWLHEQTRGKPFDCWAYIDPKTQKPIALFFRDDIFWLI